MQNPLIAILPLLVLAGTVHAQEIRIGMVGLDTSHATAFAKILNDPAGPEHVPGGKVVAGFKAHSPDIPYSVETVDKCAEELVTKWGVKLYPTIAEMCQHVDGVMIESVDGRPHLEQARAVIEAGKPVFIDKPMAGSLKDAIAIFKLAEEKGVPCWSASNLRFHPGVVEAKAAKVGQLTAAFSYGPAPLEPHHPDLFWYGIHPVETLYTVMGPGCQTVARTFSEGTDIVTGQWKDGKPGVVMGIRAGKRAYSIQVFGTEAIVEKAAGGAYPQLLKEVIAFFQTKKTPVTPAETVEIHAFMEAADVSKAQGGKPVNLPEYMAQHGWK